jgi:biopolymer transport protein ExbB/TolQ
MIFDVDPMSINSAKQLRRREEMRQLEADRQREVDSAILDSAARSKMQVVILEKQLVEARRTNELLVQQATDAALDARKSRNIAWLSVGISILAIIATVAIGVLF